MADHVVILQHGILGSTEDLNKLGKALRCWHHGKPRIILSDVNENRTLDGVVQGGTRLANLIKCNRPSDGGSLSFVCHSLGGIYARSALAILESEGWLAELQTSNVEIANFVTLASPHLGIGELGAILRHGAGFLGGVKLLPQTPRDLFLQTEVLLRLSSGSGLKALERFSRRAVYANWDDDMWVRCCSGLILPSLPSLADEPLAEREPRRVAEDKEADAGCLELGRFPRKHHDHIRHMLQNLNQLPWERYVVFFPFEKWSGAAHIKICNHPKDENNCGENVLAHICQTFRFPQEEEAALEGFPLRPRVISIQDRSLPDTTGSSNVLEESFSCFALRGLFEMSGTWAEEKGNNLDQARMWMQQHDGKHSHAVVKVRLTLEGEQAEWYHAWLPSNNWHKSHIIARVKMHYPQIEGNMDVVLKSQGTC